MTLKEKLKWKGALTSIFDGIKEKQHDIASGKATALTYSFLLSHTVAHAIECYVEGDLQKSKDAAKLVVNAALEYCYGQWQKRLPTPDGKVGHEAWKHEFAWYPEAIEPLPWACALGDWEAVRKIAEYPPEDRFPEASRAGGETAWAWALVMFLRGRPRKEVEQFLARAEGHKAKRPKLLGPVLKALLDTNQREFNGALSAYLVYYRKREFKLELNKLLAFDATVLWHLGLKAGFQIELTDSASDHIIRLS